MAWPQAYQVAGVCHICEFSYFYKAFFRNLAVEKYKGVRDYQDGGVETSGSQAWQRML